MRESSLELLHVAELLEEAPRASGAPTLATAEQQYQFTHTLVQEVVYQNLLVGALNCTDTLAMRWRRCAPGSHSD